MKRINSVIALSLFTAVNIYADQVVIDNINYINTLPLNLESTEQFCYYSIPDGGEGIAGITIDENGLHFAKPAVTTSKGETSGIIRIDDTPGFLTLEVATGRDNMCVSSNHNKLYVYSSADNVEYKELLALNNQQGTYQIALEKDSRYVKFRFTNTSGFCGHKYSPVKVSLPKVLSKNTDALAISAMYPEVITDTLFVDYSNPSSNLTLSCDISNVSFERITEEEEGKEGTAAYLVSFVSENIGEFAGNIIVSDNSNPDLDLTIPFSAVVTKDFYPESPVISVERKSFESLDLSWNEDEAVVEYEVEIFEGDNLIESLVLGETFCKITGLARNTEYKISIISKAHNGNYSEEPYMLSVSTLAEYGDQLDNLGFEEWKSAAFASFGYEPLNWHSFGSAGGTFAGFARSKQLEQSDEVRPGSKGKSSAKIFTKYVSIAKTIANGNLTTGKINAGATSATDLRNYNSLIMDDSVYCTSIGSRLPDSVTVWVKYYPASFNEDMMARISFIAHDYGEVKDPRAEESPLTVGIAEMNYNDTIWVRQSFPFNRINADLNPERLYILGTFTTNSNPGEGTDPTGANVDNVFIDDLLFIYNPTLEISSISNNSLEDNEEFIIGFELNGTMSPSNSNAERNKVTLEMSDINGSFENPVIVSIEPVYTDESGEIRGRIPENIYTGDYKIRVVTTNYPMESEPVNVKVEGAIQVGINENVASADYILYPNPAKDVVTVKGAEGLVYRVFSVNGAAMMSGTLPYNGSLEVSSLSNGIYFIEVEAADKSVSVIKFIKK